MEMSNLTISALWGVGVGVTQFAGMGLWMHMHPYNPEAGPYGWKPFFKKALYWTLVVFWPAMVVLGVMIEMADMHRRRGGGVDGHNRKGGNGRWINRG